VASRLPSAGIEPGGFGLGRQTSGDGDRLKKAGWQVFSLLMGRTDKRRFIESVNSEQ